MKDLPEHPWVSFKKFFTPMKSLAQVVQLIVSGLMSRVVIECCSRWFLCDIIEFDVFEVVATVSGLFAAASFCTSLSSRAWFFLIDLASNREEK